MSAPLTNDQAVILIKMHALRLEIDELKQKLMGIGRTPRKLRAMRQAEWESQLKAKVKEHNKLLDEFNASTSSQPKA